MTNIIPVSDLRNYPSVLEQVSKDNPVYLTKNGRGAYVIMEIAEFEEYTKEKAAMQLMIELSKGTNNENYSSDYVKQHIKDKLNELFNK